MFSGIFHRLLPIVTEVGEKISFLCTEKLKIFGTGATSCGETANLFLIYFGFSFMFARPCHEHPADAYVNGRQSTCL